MYTCHIPLAYSVLQIDLLLSIDVQRRQELDSLKMEQTRIIDVLKNILHDQEQRPKCRHCANFSNIASANEHSHIYAGEYGGKVTTL